MNKVVVMTESKAIRKKLMAATSMLLVAAIMLISSTYAWFTLSTAPEVSGITTTVGANGNLEMALANDTTWGAGAPESGIGQSLSVTGAGDSKHNANITWGNLIDLSDVYGLENISLLPSRLDYDSANKKVAGTFFKTPVYGYDGRVSGLPDRKATFGTYNSTANGFNATGTNYGVRAIGTASALTDRQLAYRAALAAISTEMDSAKTNAQLSLVENGNTLANAIVKKAMNTSDSYTKAEVDAIKALIEKLKLASADIKEAWEAALTAAVLSGLNSENDTTAMAAKAVIDAHNYTVDGSTITIGSYTLPDSFSSLATVYNTWKTLNDNITAAETALPVTADSYTWNQISPSLNKLIDIDKATLNGYTTDKITTADPVPEGKVGINALANAILKEGTIKVAMGADSGVYESIADFCGNYQANITGLNITAGGITLSDMPAVMSTDSDVVKESKTYLPAAKTDVSRKEPTGAAGADAKITDFYGYALDLLFRTNVAGSDLKLQTTATQRIYDDSTNTETMGSGSYMSFAGADGFTNDQIKSLMKALRVVFLSDNGSVLAMAALDTENAAMEAGELKAELKICETTEKQLSNGNGTDTVLVPATDEQGKVTFKADQTIAKGLPQNQKYRMTAMVFLDGDMVDNADVANAAYSMKGSMNLQFTSSADLKPMNNTELKGETKKN